MPPFEGDNQCCVERKSSTAEQVPPKFRLVSLTHVNAGDLLRPK